MFFNIVLVKCGIVLAGVYDVLDVLIIDWDIFQQVCIELGVDFICIFGYFCEDGVKFVIVIEVVMCVGDVIVFVILVYMLKGEVWQFGVEVFVDFVENIEIFVCQCVEYWEMFDEFVFEVVKLCLLFIEMLMLFEVEINFLVEWCGFGKKVLVINQGFGRIQFLVGFDWS